MFQNRFFFWTNHQKMKPGQKFLLFIAILPLLLVLIPTAIFGLFALRKQFKKARRQMEMETVKINGTVIDVDPSPVADKYLNA